MPQTQVRVFDPAATQHLTELRAHAKDLERRQKSSDMLQQQLRKERDQAPASQRFQLEKRAMEAHLDFVDATAQLEATNQQIKELQGVAPAQPVAIVEQPAPPPQPVAIVGQPAPESFPRAQDIATMYAGGIVLLLPLVVTLARRLWVRGVRRESLDLENSPRLQRIEQAVESIAIEVERIGEAQRFTTRLLAERQLDAAPRIPVQPRREPGTITPH
jgi:uncharacterized protein YhaN